jgi:hypothetical protein
MLQDEEESDAADGWVRCAARVRLGKNKSKDKCEMRGSLHCAVHDETVNSFGRDDELFALAEVVETSSGEKRVSELGGGAEE